MTTFDRQRHLLELLHGQPGIRVPEIARALSVSEGTVRNDLRSLAQAGRLMRVRGGAVVRATAPSGSPAFSARARVQADAKRRMAQRAADLIEDGDSILFDASTTVYHLAECLQDRRNLTIITNGVEISRSLAQNPSATVILLGGVMRTDGTSVTGPISEHVLKDLHVKTAFVSASGIALESGLYEVDIDEAQLKRKMITAASRVVALIDSSKFGKVDLTPFARLDQIAHFFVDDGLSIDWIDRLQQAGLSFTICGEDSATDYSPPLEADSAGGSGVPVSERSPYSLPGRARLT